MLNNLLFSQKIQELVALVADSYPEVEKAQKEGRQIPEKEYMKYVNESLLLLASTFVEMVERREEDIMKLFDERKQRGNC
jgi:hypothetical protein